MDLHGERTAQPPFAAHGDAEQSAQRQEDAEIGREGGQRADHRIADDVEHQDGLAAVFVGKHAEEEGADEARRQCQEQRLGDCRDVGVEFGCDIGEQECQKEEIKSVERPAEEGGKDGFLLLRIEGQDVPPSIFTDARNYRPVCVRPVVTFSRGSCDRTPPANDRSGRSSRIGSRFPDRRPSARRCRLRAPRPGGRRRADALHAPDRRRGRRHRGSRW